MGMTVLWLFLASLVALANPSLDRLYGYAGDAPVKVELLRPSPDYPRVFVQASVGGETGTFMVDTGADTSAITPSAAARWGLDVEPDWGVVQGFSGTAVVSAGTLPSLDLGGLSVPHVTVLVDVPGLPDRAEMMAIDGVLGNNVWSRFTLAIDYPSSTMTLHPPGEPQAPRRAAQLHFDGQHLKTPLRVQPPGARQPRSGVLGWVDTGASGLTLCGRAGAMFQVPYTEGLEALRGIGTPETLPPHLYFRTTRRYPVRRAWLGGRRLRSVPDMVWIDYDMSRGDACPAGFQALIGHEFFARHVLWIDYGQGRLWLGKSRKERVVENGHQVLYHQDLERFGAETPDRALYRSQLLVGAHQRDRAKLTLKGLIGATQSSAADRTQARIILSRLLRLEGNFNAADQMLTEVPVGDLVEIGELLTYVQDRILHGEMARARGLCAEALRVWPEHPGGYAACAVVAQAEGAFEEAHDRWLQASQRIEFDEAYLLWRAQLAALTQDRAAAMAHMRTLLDLYPNIGHHLWFYAQLAQTDEDRDMVRADVDRAVQRLHPHERPYDFLLAAYRSLEAEEPAQDALEQGLRQHCKPLDAGPARLNCWAWYHGLAGQRLPQAERRVRRALSQDPLRSDYLDTLATVMEARGELEEAKRAASQAATLDPGDPYLIWRHQLTTGRRL